MLTRRRFLGTLGAAALAGCGRPAPRGGDTTLVFKHGKLFGDPHVLRGLLDEFERAHPGLRVREETLPSSSDEQYQFYAINLQARADVFDVLAVDIVWVAGFARAGWLKPLPDPSGFFRGPMEAVTWRGAVYALPWFVDAGLLYYRRDLVEKPPEHWHDLVRLAREPRLHGFVWQGKQYEGLVCNALEYLHSNAGAVLESERAVLASPQNREALAFMADLVHRYGITPASVTTLTEEPSRHVFGQGRAAFLRNWPYAWRLFQDPASRVHGKVAVAELPRFPGGRSAPTLGGWQLAVNAASRYAEAAERLVRFMTSEPAQKRLAIAYGFQPSRVALYRDPELLAAQPFLGTLERIFAAARPRPVTPQYVRVSQVLQAELSAAVSGLRTADEALSRAQRGVEEILRAA
jgi:multiple sugar transport system substrate-binding protein